MRPGVHKGISSVICDVKMKRKSWQSIHWANSTKRVFYIYSVYNYTTWSRSELRKLSISDAKNIGTTKNKTWSHAKNEQIFIYRKLGNVWSNQSERIREWDGLQIQCTKSEKIMEFDYKCIISLWQPCLCLGFSESDSVICNIKLGVIRTNKDISENPQRSSRHI